MCNTSGFPDEEIETETYPSLFLLFIDHQTSTAQHKGFRDSTYPQGDEEFSGMRLQTLFF